MIINFNGKEIKLEFTFNSFKYMENLNLMEMQELENKPFKIIGVTETLLYGAVNSNPKEYHSLEEVDEFLETFIADDSIADLLQGMMEVLQESNFFKSLQKKEQAKKRK